MTEYHNQPAAFIIDDIIKGIVNSGHPKARRLAEDYNEAREQLTKDQNIPIGTATVEALVQVLEQAYGIQYHANVADMLDSAMEYGMSKEDAQAVLITADLINDGAVFVHNGEISIKE